MNLLERQKANTSSHDRDIVAGAEWDREISQHLLDAEIILLLISTDFSPPTTSGTRAKVALERYERSEARVGPIILRVLRLGQPGPFSPTSRLYPAMLAP